jgi:PAS domain S-box-containing protein
LALLEEAQRLARLGSWRFDPETGETEWSLEFRRIAGLPLDVAANVETFLERIHPSNRSEFVSRYQREMTDPRGGEVDGRVLDPNGEVRHFRLRGALVTGANGQPELRGTILDITDQVRLQEQLAHARKMEAIGRLAAGIAHDFNNLLTVVGGNLELLADDVGRCAEVENSLRAVESASNLTRRLLAFGRRAQLSLSVVDPNQLVASTLSLMQRLEDVSAHRALVKLESRARRDESGEWVEISVSEFGETVGGSR